MLDPTAMTDITINYHQTTCPLYDVCNINGALFALFHQTVDTKEGIDLDFEGHNLVLIASLKAEKNISIKAINTWRYRVFKRTK